MFARLAIRHKLIVLLAASAGMALLISFLVNGYASYRSEARMLKRNLHQMTQILSENLSAAVAFHDDASAKKIQAALHADPHILLAITTDENDHVVGVYRGTHLTANREQHYRQQFQDQLQSLGASGEQAAGVIEYDDHEMRAVLRPILLDGRRIGHLLLVSDNEQQWAAMRAFVLLQLFSSVLILLLIIALSYRLQAVFTQPILNLIQAMQAVAKTRNYNQSLHSGRRDEFDDLYQGYNAMLAVIHERDERLSRLATTDALTGLANRSQAMETLEIMLLRAQRKNEPLGVIMLDIDYFKAVNDTYGHQTGDEVLQAVAQVLRTNAREYDLVARLGGEEFLVLCDSSTTDIALAIAERIRQGVELLACRSAQGQVFNVTASLGVYACSSTQQVTMAQLIRVADQALYQAKAEGRNRYILAADEVAG